MKVGTDSVILGAWAPLQNPENVLDIGAGTGVLSLMLAQRYEQSRIDAVEIEPEAFSECRENFQNSIWDSRLTAYCADIVCFTQQAPQRYDAIVSNPPFFTEDFIYSDKKREKARSAKSLPLEKLLWCVAKLLKNSGIFCVVVPFAQETDICLLAQSYGLFPFEILRTQGMPQSPIKRSFLSFSSEKHIQVKEDQLIIEKQRHLYTQAYVQLTKDFYLNF